MELKHGYYHLIAILVVAIWGLTFISTKVLINHGLTPQEIFFYRFFCGKRSIDGRRIRPDCRHLKKQPHRHLDLYFFVFRLLVLGQME